MPATAVAQHGDALAVDAELVGVIGQPAQGGPAVLVGRRIGLLGREAVLDRDDDGVQRADDVDVERVVHRGRADDQTAAVDVEDGGSPGPRPGGAQDAHGGLVEHLHLDAVVVERRERRPHLRHRRPHRGRVAQVGLRVVAQDCQLGVHGATLATNRPVGKLSRHAWEREGLMRLVRFGDDRTGVLRDAPDGTVVVDLGALDGAPDTADWRPLIAGWEQTGPAVDALVQAAGTTPDGVRVFALDDVALRPPLPSIGSRIFAMGVNFRSHVGNAASAVGVKDPTQDDTRPPAGFFVIPGTLAGPGQDVEPPDDVRALDYEAEVAAVLAVGGRHLAPEDVRFWGHAAFNDISIRDPHLKYSRLDEGSLAWGLQKNFQGGNALGPWIAVGEGHDLADLHIRSSVNGEQRQDGSTAQMILSFAEGVAYLSRYLELQPGDMLTSGTPGGTAIEQGADGPFLRPGDEIEVEIEGAGTLRNRVVGRFGKETS